MFLADTKPEWLQWILDPLHGDPALAWTMLGIAAPLALVFSVLLFGWIRRHGPSGGALTTEGFVVGLPLAAAVMILPAMIKPLQHNFDGSFTVHSLVQYALVQIVLTLAAVFILYRNPLERKTERPQWLAVQPRMFARTLLAWVMALIALQAAMVMGVAIMRLNGSPVTVQPVLQHMVGDRSPSGVIGAYLMVVAGAPLSEEFAFRLVLYGGLRRVFTAAIGERGVHWVALVLSVAAFVAVHGLFAPELLYLIAPMTILSVALTLTYAHTRSLWPSVFFHAIHNAMALTIALYLQ